MRKYSVFALILISILVIIGAFQFHNYWLHRYDELIDKQAKIYKLDNRLVWSVIYEETYFRAWMIGADEEVGLMQITPTVAREWAKETGLKEFEKQMAENHVEFLKQPEKNIQIGCWYLEKMRENYLGSPAQDAMMLAAYNAGASRVEEWTKDANPETISEEEFIERIGISTTKSYVSSILKRYRQTQTDQTANVQK